MDLASLVGLLVAIGAVFPAIGTYFVLKHRTSKLEEEQARQGDKLEDHSHRITVVETEQTGVKSDIQEIKDDVRKVLEMLMRRIGNSHVD